MSEYQRLAKAAQAVSAARVTVADRIPDGCPAVVVAATDLAEVPASLQTTVAALETVGFEGSAGQVATIPGTPVVVVAGLDPAAGADGWRDAIALAVRAAVPHTDLAVLLGDHADPETVRAAVEGALLSRYAYDALRATAKGRPLTALTVVTPGVTESLRAAAALGWAGAQATALARDLANTPHNHMTASTLADIATELADRAGLRAEVWDADRIRSEGLGGVLAINAGSAQPPRVVILSYSPPGTPTGHLALVGKGIMYDSGGIGLKPNNDSHAQMKNDMTGAASILAAMLQLPGAGGTAAVTGYLMCTDNMPSATATALGDVVTMRGGRTVEIIDTDAEGRMVLADGIVMAGEAAPDAIVDIATLTGSVARALGPRIAGTVSSDDGVNADIQHAARRTGEPVWRLPLATTYAGELDSPVADLRNVAPMSVPDGLIAALFLHRFAGDIPWGHIDIAGVGWSAEDAGHRTTGCTGFGARLLLELARGYRSDSERGTPGTAPELG